MVNLTVYWTCFVTPLQSHSTTKVASSRDEEKCGSCSVQGPGLLSG